MRSFLIIRSYSFLNAAHAQSVRQDGITDLGMFVRKNKQKLAAIAHPGPRGIESRQKPSKMPESCLPTRPKSVRTEAKVDKNRAKCLNLFYHPPKKNMHKKAAALTLRLLKIIYFSTQPPSIGTFAP